MHQVFQISKVVGGIPFSVGFCAAWQFTEDGLCVIYPFSHMTLHEGRFLFNCRGPWTLGKVLNPEEFEISPYPYQFWMELDAEDLVAAFNLCRASSKRLPRGGFRRL